MEPGQAYRRLPDAELEIMKIIWEAGVPMTSADIMGQIKPRNKWANTTVLNFLSRLVDKGFVGTYKQGRYNVYTALADECRYLNEQGADLLNRLYQGSLSSMVSSLYEAQVINDDDLLELNDFIAAKLPPPTSEAEHANQGSRWKRWYHRYFHIE